MSENMGKAPQPPVPPEASGVATQVLPPVPLPDGSKPRPKWVTPALAAGCAAALAAAGLGGWVAWDRHETGVARAACDAAYARTVKERARLDDYLKSDALSAVSAVKADEVKDAKTVTTLASRVKTAKAALVSTPQCDAGSANGLRDVASRLDGLSDAYVKARGLVSKSMTAVESSRTDRTVDAANALLKSSEGKVADEGTRDALAKAVKARDVQAIQAATVKVNDSVKTKADADARAQAEQAAQQAAVQAQASSAGQSTTGGRYANTGYANTGYSGGSYNYGGGYGGGSAASGTPSTPAPSGGNGGYDAFDPDGDGWGGGCEVSESHPSCDWEMTW